MSRHKPQPARVLKTVSEYLLIVVGALILAANVSLFLEPNHVVSGGVTGIGMLTHYLWGWPIGLVVFSINVPLLLVAIKWGGGWRMFVRTVFAVIVMALGMDLLSNILPSIELDPLLYTLFGGLLDGLGIGLVLRGRGTTGGSDIVAQLLNRYAGVPFGQVLMAVNGTMLLAAALVVGLEPVLYALVVIYVAGRVVDFVQEGGGYARAAMVITNDHEAICQSVFQQLGRGVTVLEGRGGYTNELHSVLYIVVARTQLTRLKHIISEIDPDAFVVVSEAHEVLGEGFQPVCQEA